MIIEDNRFKDRTPNEEDYFLALELLDYLDHSNLLTEDESKALDVISNALVDISDPERPDAGNEVAYDRANVKVSLSFRKPYTVDDLPD